jgi:hypothetical protein
MNNEIIFEKELNSRIEAHLKLVKASMVDYEANWQEEWKKTKKIMEALRNSEAPMVLKQIYDKHVRSVESDISPEECPGSPKELTYTGLRNWIYLAHRPLKITAWNNKDNEFVPREPSEFEHFLFDELPVAISSIAYNSEEKDSINTYYGGKSVHIPSAKYYDYIQASCTDSKHIKLEYGKYSYSVHDWENIRKPTGMIVLPQEDRKGISRALNEFYQKQPASLR